MANLIQFIVFMEVFRGWSPRSLVEKKEKGKIETLCLEDCSSDKATP